MIIKILLFVTVVVGVQACTTRASVQSESSPVFERHVQQMSSKRDALKFDPMAVVHDCKEYLQLRPNHSIAEDFRNKIISKQYLTCDFLGVYTSSSILPNESGFDKNLGQSLCERLDLSSFEHSIRPALEGKAVTLIEIFKFDAKAEASECRVDTLDRSFSVKAVLQDSSPEGVRYLAQVIDEIKDGSYRDYQSIWLYPPEKGKGNYMVARPLYSAGL